MRSVNPLPAWWALMSVRQACAIPKSTSVSITWLALLLLAWLVVLLWYSYHFYTWRKDEYQVTPTAIIDYKDSAFNLQGEEETVGTFDVIQNTTYFTPNFVAKLLNIGHVVIETAGTERTFTFKWVYNPSAIQQEIFKRWLAHKEAKVQRDWAYEKRRFERWFGEFYDIIGPREASDGDKANTEETCTSLE